MSKAPTLYEAIEGLLGPLTAEYGRLIEEARPEMPISIMLGGYEFKTTMSVLQDLDRAHMAAHDAKQAKRARKSVGSLL